MKSKSVPLPEPVRLTEGCCHEGRYYPPGEPLPFASASEVPAPLRHLIVTDESEIPTKPVRNLYDGTPQPEPRYVYQSAGDMRGAQQIIQGWHASDEVVEIANQPLAPDVEEALQAAHDKYISKAKAQMQFNQDAIDNAHEVVPTDSAPLIQSYVLRDDTFTRVEEVELLPAEPVFMRHHSGTFEIFGYVDSDGELPELPIRT